MSNIDKRALREAAERAGQNDWEYVYTSDLSAPGRGYITVGGAEAIYCLNKAAGGVKQSENVLRYIAAASPETMLALLNEIAELEQRHCGTALLEREEMHTKTLGRMLDELDAKDRRIAELEAREVKLPNPHAHLIWIQAGHAPDDYWDDVAVSHSEMISAATVQIAIRFMLSGKSKRHYLLLASTSPQPVKVSEHEIRNTGIRRY